MAETHPVGTFPPSEANPNPELRKMELKDLQNLVEWPSRMEEFVQERAAPEPASAPEPIPESEPQIETEAPAEAEPAAEATEAPPAEPSSEEIERQLLIARLEAQEAHGKKLEAKLTGREAGERGYIKQLQEENRRLRAGYTPEPEAEPSYRESPSPEAPEAAHPDNLRHWAAQQAAKEAAVGFAQSHPDMNEIGPQVVQNLQTSGFDFNQLAASGDPISAAREMTRALDESYWHVKESIKRAKVTELETKRAESVRGIEELKRKASTSAPGSTAPPPAPHKSVQDLSLAELEAKMKALGRR